MNLACPIPLERYPQVLLAHGGGGKLSQQLLKQIFLPAFGASETGSHDAAVFTVNPGSWAFTTDSYVINPLFFPGGDIGSLAVHGTVNDLAMAGATPRYISVGFILEEGLSMETLWRIAQSLGQAAKNCGVEIITGDTKVVDRGKGDGIFINTSGIGSLDHQQTIHPSQVQVGDRLILSGDLGRHGMAIMAVRQGLEFETTIESDSAPVHQEVEALLSAEIPIHCLRDLTRGGLASAVNEIAQAAGVTMALRENLIPVETEVQAACELLGFDPLYVANEGRFLAIVPPTAEQKTLEILQTFHPQATAIGEVTGKSEQSLGLVSLESRIGASRLLDMISGEQLPRIC
ncbi:hydrogenase expression/formation protein HypE [Synechocystis sp. PCC 7339]|uniref:hydrogenase expression/formation protein HypE n=1 Tax=unclassified Synechocystis TaxID=2640012 RepID=UPI001BAE8E57|nr:MULTISPECIES: hydrogenase expression/formation protein HypE [unclassified Synechocystis]QUS61249.1 hydrogenase expression/formation protein HypE [Synechocystis sp. PCC 7338]UAJ73436.1 hydrogenase expression/formation protein HypE [Synechocystis sp. PCC 7339]